MPGLHLVLEIIDTMDQERCTHTHSRVLIAKNGGARVCLPRPGHLGREQERFPERNRATLPKKVQSGIGTRTASAADFGLLQKAKKNRPHYGTYVGLCERDARGLLHHWGLRLADVLGSKRVWRGDA